MVGTSTSKSHKSRKSGSDAASTARSTTSTPDQTADAASNADSSLPPSLSKMFKPAEMPAGMSLVAALKGDAPKLAEPTQAITVLSQADPDAKPFWYRPPDSKARKQFEKIAVMREAGRPDHEIAKRLHTTEQNVRQIVYLAKKNGWADDDGEPVDVEAELAMEVDRKVVRNISSTLDGQMTNWQTHEMTIAAAKGRGIFKNHEKSEGGHVQLPVVAIRIEMPTLGAPQQIVESNVGGTPAYIEGELADGTEPERTEPALLPGASQST